MYTTSEKCNMSHAFWIFKIPRDRGSDMHAILWKGEEPDKVSGGHCLIKWPLAGDLQAHGKRWFGYLISRMFRKGFKIKLDVAQVEKQRKNLVWTRHPLWVVTRQIGTCFMLQFWSRQGKGIWLCSGSQVGLKEVPLETMPLCNSKKASTNKILETNAWKKQPLSRAHAANFNTSWHRNLYSSGKLSEGPKVI